jgi:hypothetical protein
MKKEIYVLVGPAAIGKSTYTKNAGFPVDKLKIVNRDDVVARVSRQYGLDFDDMYHFPPHDAVPGTFVKGKEMYGKVIISPKVVIHLHPFSYQYLDSVNAEINYAFYNEFQSAIRNTDIHHVVIDRVHMRSYERKAYFEYLEPFRQNYVVTAVLFNFQDPDTLDVIEQVSALRTKALAGTGGRIRTVSRKVQENMIKFYEEPTKEEGFDSIIKVDTLPELRKLIGTSEN